MNLNNKQYMHQIHPPSNFLSLVAQWKLTRDLALKNCDFEAKKILDIVFADLIKKTRTISPYKRKYTGYGLINSHNGLNMKEAFLLELEIYTRITNKNNFPKLLSFNKKKLELIIEDCGISLNCYRDHSLSINNLNDQIKNICQILENNKIYHLDIKESNICIKNG
jgi:hypothetical protein